ncbi:MAG: threonylcarbamoyl-AMP synthase [Desulfobacteraceae bacterium]|nr:MAG: threonylcarbamoyl-AMP synthase [Desulfobacteraceae bacterium]
MPAEIVTLRNPESIPAGLERAAVVLLEGGLIAVPTESFYGLAVNALNEKAIRRLLSAKRIEGGHPILLLVSSMKMVNGCVSEMPSIARELIRIFWPGGLTLVMKAAPTISPLLTAGTGKIGVRLSSHPIPTGLVEAVDLPITGTSANITGSKPCVSADEVREALGSELDLILDVGTTEGGKGSTILDLTYDPPRMIREGMLSRADLGGLLPES